MSGLANWIAGLMRTDYNALGFIPEPTVEYQYIRNNRYVLQLNESGKGVGYLLYGAINIARPVVITQAIIDYDYRLKGYGEQAVNELIRRAKLGNASSIRLQIASELPALEFYQALGFTEIGRIQDGNVRKREKIQMIYPLSLPLLRLCELARALGI